MTVEAIYGLFYALNVWTKSAQHIFLHALLLRKPKKHKPPIVNQQNVVYYYKCSLCDAAVFIELRCCVYTAVAKHLLCGGLSLLHCPLPHGAIFLQQFLHSCFNLRADHFRRQRLHKIDISKLHAGLRGGIVRLVVHNSSVLFLLLNDI